MQTALSEGFGGRANAGFSSSRWGKAPRLFYACDRVFLIRLNSCSFISPFAYRFSRISIAVSFVLLLGLIGHREKPTARNPMTATGTSQKNAIPIQCQLHIPSYIINVLPFTRPSVSNMDQQHPCQWHNLRINQRRC